ncbi:MAG: ABC transporter permease [Actinomycetota bacterium]
MHTFALALRQLRYENKVFWRNPPRAFFTFAFPLMFLFIFTLLLGDGDAATFFVPSITAFSVITACGTNVAMTICFARDEGKLKRIRGTPLPSAAYIAGHMMHSCLIALLLVIIVCSVGAALFDVELPTDTLPAFLLTLTVGAAAFCSLGLALTIPVPNADSAPAIVNAVTLPLLFVSGVFFPLEGAPGWLRSLADVFPVKHFVDALLAAFGVQGEIGLKGGDLLVIALWGLAGALLSVRFFRWEPRP